MPTSCTHAARTKKKEHLRRLTGGFPFVRSIHRPGSCKGRKKDRERPERPGEQESDGGSQLLVQGVGSPHRTGLHADMRESACHCSRRSPFSDPPPAVFTAFMMNRNVLSHLLLNSWKEQGQLDTGSASLCGLGLRAGPLSPSPWMRGSSWQPKSHTNRVGNR